MSNVRSFCLAWGLLSAFVLLGLSACSGSGSGTCVGEGCVVLCETNGDCPGGQTCDTTNGVCKAPLADGDNAETEAEVEVQETRKIRVAPSLALDFGDSQLSATPEITVTLYNDGNSPLHLKELAWVEPQTNNPFSAPDYSAATIQGGQKFDFHVRLEALGLGAVNGKLSIPNDSDNIPELSFTVKANVLQDVGTAVIGISPEAVVFQDQKVGALAQQVRFRIGNQGGGDSKIILSDMAMGSGLNTPFYVAYEVDGTPYTKIPQSSPIFIGAKSSQLFIAYFDPDTAGQASDKVVFSYHTDKDANAVDVEVPVSGKAVAGDVLCFPSPIDFAAVTGGSAKTISVRLINGAATSYSISALQAGVKAEERSLFTLALKSPSTSFPVTVAPGAAVDFDLTYKAPSTPKDLDTVLQVTTSLGGAPYHFPIKATGLAMNQKPVARIALIDHGADIKTAINLAQGDSLQLYGNISYDPDGDSSKLTYKWTVQQPGGGMSSYLPSDTSKNVSIGFDVGGSYTIMLVVKDELGAESDPKMIPVTVSSSLSTIRVEMVTSGISGASDADLSWVVPTGQKCNETTAPSGTCLLPSGVGNVSVSACGSASQCTTEMITHTGATNGDYEIRVKFDQNCPDTTYKCPLGFGVETLTFDLKVMVNGSQLATFNGLTIADKDVERTWTLSLNNGVWTVPVEKLSR